MKNKWISWIIGLAILLFLLNDIGVFDLSNIFSAQTPAPTGFGSGGGGT